MTASESKTSTPDRLGTTWERHQLRTAWIAAGLGFGLVGLIAFVLLPRGLAPWASVPVALFGAYVLHWTFTLRLARRRRLLRQPFPSTWNIVLQQEVVFFRALDPDGQTRFRRELQVFLGEKRVTGVGTTVDATTRVLAGVSAIIPIFGFREWEWHQISEVLIYPSRFDDDFSFEGPGRATMGMVGTGPMNGLMILSKPDLIRGFRDANDRQNVGIHEFAHLVDKSDGVIDGLPSVGLDSRAIGPWIELVRLKMQEIESGDSDIDDYALTNGAEFFAVATEYFFERPGAMAKKHPKLYAMLETIFRQDLRSRAPALRAERTRPRTKLGRNDPCPCGSGKKYKKCCLRKRRSAS